MTDRPIRLDAGATTLLIDARGPGMPRILYWGARLPGATDTAVLAQADARPMPNAVLDADVRPGLLPEPGLGWFGRPGLAGARDGRDFATAFAVDGVETEESRAVFRLSDPVAGLSLVLTIAIDPPTGVLAASSRLTNTGDAPYALQALAAAVWPVPFDATEALVLDGQWNGEFREARQALGLGAFLRENRRGRTSHDRFPGLVLGRPGFGERAGAVHGLHLGWSGNHALAVERSVDGTALAYLEPLLEPGEIVLAPGESYETPTAYGVFAPDGLEDMAARFHGFARRRLIDWPGGVPAPRPVHLNTWEAVYFDHDLEALTALAEAGAALGVERFVLDDGWFRGRDDDTRALGDWTPDPRKWPNGLGPLAERVAAAGMQFGLWVEPEMVNPDSDLMRAHPDWAQALEGRDRPIGRHQLVLDLTRVDVSDHLFACLDTLLDAYPVAYLKWDMNRDVAPRARTGAEAAGRPGADAQTRAYYALIDRLRVAHPGVEIESCASGGGRVDFGVLSRVHRFWPSDNNDALSRQAIQRGFLRFLPPEVMGAHIGPSPGHTTGRRLDIGLRAATALIGHMGLELDVRALDADERHAVAAAIAVYKEWRGVIHSGRVVRADSADPTLAAHGVVAPDRGRALFVVARTGDAPTRIAPPLALPGLDPDRAYRVRLALPAPDDARMTTPVLEAIAGEGALLPGAALTTIGLRLPVLWPGTALVLAVTEA
ncbi:MAG: alpha-galactosidase [Azospirillaceae bacterium]